MRYTVEKTFRIPIGHRLSKHKGLCCNIHGHNIVLKIQLSSNKLNENDMVIDFKDFKKFVDAEVVSVLDHCMIVNKDDIELADHLKKNNSKYLTVPADPTAEKMCELIFEGLTTSIVNKSGFENINIDYVKIWENENSVASYTKF